MNHRHRPVPCPGARGARLAALVLAAACAAAPALAAPIPHALVRVTGPALDLNALAGAGFDVVAGKPGHWAELVALPDEVARLAAAGLAVETVHADLAAWYAARDGKGIGFGAFHTYSESVDRLDELHALYPAITTPKFSIGTTAEGRTIWAMTVSDNPGVEENEPEVLFDALHHAREPMSTETVLLLIEYLGANYGADDRVTWLVDEREIWFVPVVNPDGYVYNESTYPNGGGMWRKNRRNNGDGSYGVDPNRNYPYEWDGPGSSPIPSDITYRGPAPGSEPEVQAMMNLALAHQFQTYQSYHTYSNLTLYPWGYTSSPTPDNALYQDIAQVMTAQNGYTPGQPPAILYEVNGGAIDWFYGEQTTKNKVISFSNEIGSSSDGFWPLDSRIPALFQDNLEPALYLIEVAGPSLFLRDVQVAGGDGNGRLDPGETAGLTFTVQNGAVGTTAAGVVFTLSSDDAYLQLLGASRAVGDLAARATWSAAGDPLPLAIDAACPVGHVVDLVVHATWNGGGKDIPVTLPVGAPTVMFSDGMEFNAIGWDRQSPWAVTTAQSHSPTRSLTDSPAGLYANGVNVSATIRSPFDFTLFREPVLRFWHRYAFENGYDFGYVEVSPDGGTTWQAIASYTGTQTAWQQVVISLADFEGYGSVRVRLRVQTDGSLQADGWYVDDLSISGYSPTTNLPPTAPVALSPVGGVSLSTRNPLLTVANAADGDGPSPLTYGFRVHDAPLLDSPPIATTAGEPEGAGGQTSWSENTGLPKRLRTGQQYWWRAWADDGAQRGPLSATATYVVDLTAVPGESPGFLLASPGEGGTAFRFAPSRPGRATLAIYNLRGERVATLFAGEAAGETGLTWDERDAAGRRVASGLYLARLTGTATQLSLKVSIVR